MKNRKGGMAMGAGILFIVIVLAGLAVFTFAPMLTGKLSVADEGAKTPTAQTDFCSNNAQLDMYIRDKNVLSSSTDYLNQTVYLVDLDSGAIVEKTIDLTTGDWDTHTNVFVCGNEKGYKIYGKTTRDGYNAIEEPVTIAPSDLFQDPVYVNLEGSKHTLLKVKAYDNANRASLTNDSSAVSTEYVTIASTARFNGSGMNVGTDGYVDVTFTLAPDSSNEAGGRDAVICVDYADSSNTDDWDGDSLQLTFEGKTLSEATLTGNDAMAVSDYEVCYDLPHPVGKSATGSYDSVSTLDLYISSQSGVNPDDDLVLRYVEKGDYLDDDVEAMLVGVLARTDSARTLIGSATASTITLDIDNTA